MIRQFWQTRVHYVEGHENEHVSILRVLMNKLQKWCWKKDRRKGVDKNMHCHGCTGL